jgi:hypothetical protein
MYIKNIFYQAIKNAKKTEPQEPNCLCGHCNKLTEE